MEWKNNKLAKHGLIFCANEYVDTLDNAPNAWGVHISVHFDIASHELLFRMGETFGRDAASHAINRTFVERRQEQLQTNWDNAGADQ